MYGPHTRRNSSQPSAGEAYQRAAAARISGPPRRSYMRSELSGLMRPGTDSRWR